MKKKNKNINYIALLKELDDAKKAGFTTDGFYFSDEAETIHGPYETLDIAEENYHKYFDELDRPKQNN